LRNFQQVATSALFYVEEKRAGNKEVLMLKSAFYVAVVFAEISSIALAEDLSSATAPPGTFTTSAHFDEWKIANALSAGPPASPST
jgi:hypothetical protein